MNMKALTIACMMLCCTVGLYSQTTATYDNVRARQQLTLNGKTLTSILEVIDSASTNAQGATAKAVWDLVVAKYATITAGTGIDVTGTSPNYTISLDTLKRLYFRTDSTYTGGVGVVRWNNVDGTLEFGLAGGVVTLSIGQESVQHVKHADNTGLENGKVVYLTGSTGDNITVRYARANSEATSAGTFGVMTETVTGGNKGYCTTFGLVKDINTSNLTEGKIVWLSKDTAGAMTAVRPTAPNHGVEVGFCIRKHATTGIIFVTVQNGYELDELHNVHVPSPSNNQALVYKSGNSRWEAMTIDTSSTNEGKLQGFKPSNNLYYDINTNTSGGTPITLYRGTGIGFDGTGGSPDGGSLTINNTGDLSEYNEGTLGVGAGSSTTSVISSNTSGATGVTIAAGNGMSISETTSSNGGTITVTALDSLATNEGTLGVGAGSSTTSVITSNTSGASGVTITAGGGISVSETTSSNGGSITVTATDGSVSNEGKLSTRLDTGADVWIRSNTSTSDDIGIVAGTGVTISGINSSSGGQIVVSSPAQTIDTFSVSGSTLSLSLSNDGQPAKTVTLPGGGGGVTSLNSLTGALSVAGAGINTVGTAGSTITVTGTEVDGSVTNELQTIDQFSLSGQTLSASLSSDGVAPSTVTLPVVGITAGTNVTVSESGGNFTINSTGGSSLLGVTGYVPHFNSTTTIDTTGLFWGNGSRLGIRTATPGASLQINGAGATSGTSSLLINNSGASELFRVSDNGLISVGKNVSVSTQSSSQIQAVSGDANTNVVITPKANGAFILGPAPDGTTVGGSARGIRAVDLVYNRNAANQVASGNYSALIGGYQNRASGESSGVFCSDASSATANSSTVFASNSSNNGQYYSAIIASSGSSTSGALSANSVVLCGNYSSSSVSNALVVGDGSSAHLNASIVHASGRFVTSGDAQNMRVQVRRSITGTAAQDLFINGSSTQLVIPANRAWNARVQLTAICTTAGGTVSVGDTYTANYSIGIKRITNATSLVGTMQTITAPQSDASMSTSTVTMSAGDTNEALVISFTPPTTAGAGTIIRVVATVEITVVGY